MSWWRLRSGRRPFTPEIAGSNPAQDTDSQVVERETRGSQKAVPERREGSSPSLANWQVVFV